MFSVQRSTFALLLALALLTGCVTKNAVNSSTSTVFGIQMDQNQNGVPSLKFGLIRSEWHVVPVSSNSSPSVMAVTDAELQPFGRDRIHKVFAVGEAVRAPATTSWFPAEQPSDVPRSPPAATTAPSPITPAKFGGATFAEPELTIR